MAGRFELVADPRGAIHFELLDPQGTLLLQGLASNSKIMVQNEVLHTRQSVVDDQRVVLHETGEGQHVMVVKDHDGTVLARSPKLAPSVDLAAMREQIRSNAASAPLIDRTKPRGGRRAS
ncbi:MAG: hypothetical protein JNK49_18460 [Planctomycetes bacterium]|nr:hypothetical protein [Planctomycetota bacterium]